MAGANGHFALSLAGRPCYNRCDQLVDDLLSKVAAFRVFYSYFYAFSPLQGELLEGELQPSTPLGAHLVHTANQRKKLLAEVQNDLEELQPTSNPVSRLKYSLAIRTVEPTINDSPKNIDLDLKYSPSCIDNYVSDF